jgi:predicted aminopeptidase
MVFMISLLGCAGPGYYVQAATGHWKLMHARQDIDELLGSSSIDPELNKSLGNARAILGFADTELGLPAGKSYQSYVETGRSAVVWNVVATPEFSLQAKKWCFPVAGCVPYRGYFKEAKARDFAQKFIDRGFDVSVSPASAYSTLGWFADPLLDTMLSGDETRLAETLFHELAHQNIYLKGDTAFNESYASFMAMAGTRDWLEKTGNDTKLEQWTAAREANRDFQELLLRTRMALVELYGQGLSETDMRDGKSATFRRMKKEYDSIVESRWEERDYFQGWMNSGLNNARLALLQSYQGGICAFARLFETASGNFEDFDRLVRDQAGLPDEERHHWLSKGCIASDANL